MVEFGEEVLVDLRFNIAHLILFLCILAYLSNPGTTGLDIILMDTPSFGLSVFKWCPLIDWSKKAAHNCRSRGL